MFLGEPHMKGSVVWRFGLKIEVAVQRAEFFF